MRRREAIKVWSKKFVERIDFDGPYFRGTKCWEWIGRIDKGGYGRYGKDLAHRLAIGATGESVDHLCRNRRCVRPDHLEEVSRHTNNLRGVGWAGLNAAKTHCPQGHEYTPENARIGNSGGRYCRECDRERNRTEYRKEWYRQRDHRRTQRAREGHAKHEEVMP